jgi:hypothetical protein
MAQAQWLPWGLKLTGKVLCAPWVLRKGYNTLLEGEPTRVPGAPKLAGWELGLLSWTLWSTTQQGQCLLPVNPAPRLPTP